MSFPQITRQNVLDALKYIDENGLPPRYRNPKYELVSNDGKRYPPKYVIAVAAHLVSGAAIDTGTFGSAETLNYLEAQGFTLEKKLRERFTLEITRDSVISTEEGFTMDDLRHGDNYKPLDTYLKRADGTAIKRTYSKGERRNSNQTMPRIACQVFEKQLAAMSPEEKESFPICRYRSDSEVICGIYPSISEYKKRRNSFEYMTYNYGEGRRFVFYCWGIFSTLLFVQECLKRFGDEGDTFILEYREKDEREAAAEKAKEAPPEERAAEFQGYKNPFSQMLIESKNLIFRGAPGTGKTHLAREIAADIVSNGYYDDYSLLSEEQKQQIEFVQFHPSYDYTDFVEGLRPKVNDDGTMGFELRDGIFKEFVARARKNYEDSRKPKETRVRENSVREAMSEFFAGLEFGVDTFKTISGNEFTVTDVDDAYVHVFIPGNAQVNKLTLNLNDIRRMLESGEKFEKVKDVMAFFGRDYATQAYSYDLTLYKEILKLQKKSSSASVREEELKQYVFIIDEINRGEISKIFGELFFAIDPGYRGEAGAVSTQYANLHSDPDDKFYIPENVSIIGTMNDIDRSVDSFDFAMRRRFRFVELKADDCVEMLDDLENEDLKNEAIRRMSALNKEIAAVEDLNENYQIGAAYFLKLKTLSFDELWTDYLEPLLREYVQGMDDEEDIMNKFAQAYGYHEPSGETEDGNQG